MRNLLLAAGVAGLLGIFTACGGDDHAGVLPEGGTSSGGKGGTSSKTGTTGGKTSPSTDGGAGGGESTDALGPTVRITAPVAVADPNGDGVLTSDSVTVLCVVNQSEDAKATKVNTASIEIAIVGSDGKTIETKSAKATSNAEEYTADFALTAVPSGTVGFTCNAASEDKHQGSDHIDTLLDHGPTITFIEPVAESPHALGIVDVEFTVAPSPLTDDDDNSAVDEVALDIIGKDIDLSKAMDQAGHYRLQVNFADPKQFTPAPTGSTSLKVSATNKRTPTPIKAVTTEQINIDGEGPTIKITSPMDKQPVGGKVKLSFKLSDPISGIDPKTVAVDLNNDHHAFSTTDPDWSVLQDVYTYEFDSRQVKGATVQFTVNVVAKDNVGNAATPASELLYLDNFPPWIDLDPANIRTLNKQTFCSRSFDPVGPIAANDLDKATSSAFFRAMVWDRTNVDPAHKILPHASATNTATVRLYVEDDSAKPLLINNDDDPACDDVAKVDDAKLELTPIIKTGQPWYAADDATSPTAASLGCTTLVLPKPDQLCSNNISDMWQVIQDEYNKAPVLFAASPSAGLECTGVGWEFKGKITHDGWVCFATRAVDFAGNVGVSRPLRMCIDSPDVPGTPDCATMSTEPPSCTDGCTPEDRWGGSLVSWE
jgi:hypothetical protein